MWRRRRRQQRHSAAALWCSPQRGQAAWRPGRRSGVCVSVCAATCQPSRPLATQQVALSSCWVSHYSTSLVVVVCVDVIEVLTNPTAPPPSHARFHIPKWRLCVDPNTAVQLPNPRVLVGMQARYLLRTANGCIEVLGRIHGRMVSAPPPPPLAPPPPTRRSSLPPGVSPRPPTEPPPRHAADASVAALTAGAARMAGEVEDVEGEEEEEEEASSDASAGVQAVSGLQLPPLGIHAHGGVSSRALAPKKPLPQVPALAQTKLPKPRSAHYLAPPAPGVHKDMERSEATALPEQLW